MSSSPVLGSFNTRPENVFAGQREERRDANSIRRFSVVERKRPGRRRGVLAVSRHPFMAWACRYLETVRGHFAEATVKELERRYRRMAKDFEILRGMGRMGATSLGKITKEDVMEYIRFMREKGLSPSGMVHNIAALNSLALFAGNTAVEKARQRNKALFPRRLTVRYDPISEDSTAKVFRAAEGAKDWRRLEAYALVIMALCTGLRPKELRLASIKDLDLGRWIIRTVHVKGEASYGQPRRIPVRPEGRATIERYVRVRNAIVAGTAPLNDALFPAIGDKEDGYFAANSLSMLKKLVEDDIGAKFELRACRRTFGQGCIDGGASIEAVSKALGHATTKTTETYYCRKTEDAAIRELQASWNAPQGPEALRPKIGFQPDVGKVRASGFEPEF
jgi:integrase/recombinase XerD